MKPPSRSRDTLAPARREGWSEGAGAQRTAAQLRVGGFVPLTTTDYPGKLACVVFVQGCPWRCAFCHNPHLQPRRAPAQEDWRQVRSFLERRAGLLDAVVFSGGEPTVDPALPAAMREVRELGFAVGLHTAGAHPARLEAVLPLVDWVGMDVKADFASYDRVTRAHGSAAAATTSIGLLLASGIDHELRTTYHPSLIGDAQLLALADTLAGMGAKRYALQAFRAQGCDAPELISVTAPVPAHLADRIATWFPEFVVRGGA